MARAVGLKCFLCLLAISPCIQAAESVKDGKWRGFINAGASLAAGNTHSKSINLAAEAKKLTPTSKWHAYLTGLYGIQRDKSTREEFQTANMIRGGTRYDHDISAKKFTFTSLDLEHDELQLLKLRSVLATGLGRHVINRSDLTFDVMAGFTYNHESFEEDTRNAVELLLSEESTHPLSSTASFRQKFSLIPSLTDAGEYRAQFDASLNTAITEKVGLQLTLSDRYQSNPQPGVEKNDILLLLSGSYKFGPS